MKSVGKCCKDSPWMTHKERDDFICFLMTFSFRYVHNLSPKHNCGNTNKIGRERVCVCMCVCVREGEEDLHTLNNFLFLLIWPIYWLRAISFPFARLTDKDSSVCSSSTSVKDKERNK